MSMIASGPREAKPLSLVGLARALSHAPKPARTRHFYSIDFARGLAALIVLIWHYQHFFFPFAGSHRPSIAVDRQPLFGLLAPAYVGGFYAVFFFWLISGFVFTAVYAPKQTKTRDFVTNRFARLYPLHFLTLVLVAALQLLSVYLVGHEQIYANNTPGEFVRHLFMASYWGFGPGLSFNAPIWSVSIEVLIYAFFWVTLPWVFRFGVIGPLVLAAVAWVVHYRIVGLGDNDLFLCLLYFYLGCSTYLFTKAVGARPFLLAGTGTVAVAIAGAVMWLKAASVAWLGIPPLCVGILLLFCAIEAAERGHHFRAVRWVGDNTYGTYLWHVPIQIVMLIGLDRWVGSHAIALRPWFFVGFIFIVVVVARLSFVYFETPLRNRIRKVASERRRADCSSTLDDARSVR